MFLDSIIGRIKRNPVIIAAGLVALQSLVDGEPWRAVVSVFLGVAVRQFTSPAAEVKDRVEQAHVDGYLLGAGRPPQELGDSE